MFDDICKAIVYAMTDYVAPQLPAEEKEQNVPVATPEKKQYVKVIASELTVRNAPSWDDKAKAGTVKKNEVFTIASGPITVGNGKMYKLKSGLYITASEKYVQVYEK